MNPLVFLIAGGAALVIDALIDKNNRKDKDQLNLTIDDESIINYNSETENENVPRETITENGDNHGAIDDSGGGDSLGNEET